MSQIESTVNRKLKSTPYQILCIFCIVNAEAPFFGAKKGITFWQLNEFIKSNMDGLTVLTIWDCVESASDF